MNRTAIRAAAAATALLFASGCASSTLIRTTPPGAKVYLDGEYAGQTPVTMTDTKIVGATTRVELKAEGYEPFYVTITRSEEFQVGPCIGGVFVLVPFLWIMGYKPEHSYELSPLRPPPPPPPAMPPPPGAPHG